MITATQQGRNLHITVDGIEAPFIITPIPGRLGQDLTRTFIGINQRDLPAQDMEAVLWHTVDGVDASGEWIENGPNRRRIENQLSLAEAENVLLPAFYWQTVLGMNGVEAFTDAGGGLAGGVKALWLLVTALGISPLSSSSPELEALIATQVASSPKKVKQPQDRLSKA